MSDDSYERERDAEQLRMLQPAIDAFAAGYKKGRPTVILLPGGIGSCLRRADQPFNDGFNYETLWIDTDVVLWELPFLQMDGDIDYQRKFMICDGPVLVQIPQHDPWVTVAPYNRFIDWISGPGPDKCNCNSFVFGWDWRRRLDYGARFFGKKFLPALRTAVLKSPAGLDPLEDFTVVAHSMGGLLLKLWLNDDDDGLVRRVKHAVSVGTPFYGYGGQIHRYFAGMPMLEPLCPKGAENTAKIIASMDGLYALFFLPEDIWKRDLDALRHDKDYPICDYPSLDFENYQQGRKVPADPFSPGSCGDLVRYPKSRKWFHSDQLQNAKSLLEEITARLPVATAPKFHNWRGVQTGRHDVPLKDTCWSQTWKWIHPGFIPGKNVDPIQDIGGAGDDTIPAWSARLTTTPDENVCTFKGSAVAIQHMFLMENADVLKELKHLITPHEPIGAEPDTILGTPDPIARSEEIPPFLAAIRHTMRKADGQPSTDIANTILKEFDPAKVSAIVRRILADLVR